MVAAGQRHCADFKQAGQQAAGSGGGSTGAGLPGSGSASAAQTPAACLCARTPTTPPACWARRVQRRRAPACASAGIACSGRSCRACGEAGGRQSDGRGQRRRSATALRALPEPPRCTSSPPMGFWKPPGGRGAGQSPPKQDGNSTVKCHACAPTHLPWVSGQLRKDEDTVMPHTLQPASCTPIIMLRSAISVQRRWRPSKCSTQSGRALCGALQRPARRQGVGAPEPYLELELELELASAHSHRTPALVLW